MFNFTRFLFLYKFLQKFNYIFFKLLNFNRLILISLHCFLFSFVFFIINFTFETFLQKFNFFFFKLLNFNRLIFLDCLLFSFFFIINFTFETCISKFTYPRLVIGTSRTVDSAKKFVGITSGFGGGEFTKTLRKVCICQKLKFSFLLLEYCKIRECYAVANAFTIRNMYSLFLYMKCNSRKINRPTKNMTKIVTLLHF